MSLCGWSRFLKRVGEETGEFLRRRFLSRRRFLRCGSNGFFDVEVYCNSVRFTRRLRAKALCHERTRDETLAVCAAAHAFAWVRLATPVCGRVADLVEALALVGVPALRCSPSAPAKLVRLPVPGTLCAACVAASPLELPCSLSPLLPSPIHSWVARRFSSSLVATLIRHARLD